MFHNPYISGKFWMSMETKLINFKMLKSSNPYIQLKQLSQEAGQLGSLLPIRPSEKILEEVPQTAEIVIFLVSDKGN